MNKKLAFPKIQNLKAICNSRFFTFVKWSILSFFLYLFLHLAISRKILDQFIQISLPALICFLSLLLLSKIFYAYRWDFIGTKGLKLNYLSWHYLLRLNLLAEFSDIAMLSSLSGEVVRAIKVANRTAKPTLSATSIMVDRLIGLSSMVLFAVTLFPFLGFVLKKQFSLPNNLIILVISFVIITGYFCWLGWRQKIIRFPPSFSKLKLSFECLIISTLFSLVGHLFFATSYYFLFREFNLVSFPLILAIVFTAQLSNVIPLSFLGFAPSEASIVALSSLIGVTQGSALVVVTTVLASKYIFALCGFLIEFSLDGKDFLIAMRKSQTAKQKSANYKI